MKRLLFLFSAIMFLSSCDLQPTEHFSSFWGAFIPCIGLAFVWLVFAFLASRSGTKWHILNQFGHRVGYGESDENFPITKTGWWPMFLLHLVFGSIIFIMIAVDFWDVWFVVK